MKYSYHVHSTHSDGQTSIKEIIEHAQKLGLDEVGISDHFAVVPEQLISEDDTPDWIVSPKTIDAYIADIQQYTNQTSPIVKIGTEADYLPDSIEQTKQILEDKPFDYIIGSVHVVDETLIDFAPNNIPENFCTDVMKKYWILIAHMAKSGVFDIAGHLELTKKFGLHPKIDLSSEIDAALNAIAQADMTVEVNTSGWHVPAKEQYPSRELLEKCFELGIPVMVTADAHRPEHLCRDFDKALALLKNIGYTQVAYYKKRKRFFTPIL